MTGVRRTLAVAGFLAAGTLLPAPPASAVCGWTVEGVQQCGCLANEVALVVDGATAGVREQAGVGPLNEQIVCVH